MIKVHDTEEKEHIHVLLYVKLEHSSRRIAFTHLDERYKAWYLCCRHPVQCLGRNYITV